MTQKQAITLWNRMAGTANVRELMSFLESEAKEISIINYDGKEKHIRVVADFLREMASALDGGKEKL